MASGRLAAVELNKNISQSIYVCPTDDVTTVTLNVVNRRNDGIKISVALTDTLNADITDLNDATIYPLELEVPIAPKGVMERTQILVPSGKYLTLLTDEDFVTATAWGIEVGNAADPVPTPVTTNLGPTPVIGPLTLTVFDGITGIAQLTTDYETGGLITYSVDSGTLPTGVELSETGVIQGSPTGSDGDYTFTVTATTRTGVSTTQDITVKKVTTSGGDEVYTYRDADNIDYRVHYFNSAGDFINTGDLEVDVLMVAGGGGGGSHAAPGGGGAGGLIYRPKLTLSSATTTITVGQGGTGSYNPGSYGGMPNATAGGDSIFDDGNGYVLTAKGGGFGSSWSQDARSGEGGSGGGGANDISGHVVTGNQTSQAGDSGLYGYGNDGVNNTDGATQNHGGGGGGGAGSAAVDPADRNIAGRGGEGLYFGDKFGDDVGDSGWFASGGCGGKWGSNGITSLLEPHPGGGGRGDSPTGAGTGGSELRSGSGEPTGEDGMSYTGGGGGGAGRTGGSSSRGGDGGSGAVLVRYPLNNPVLPNPLSIWNLGNDGNYADDFGWSVGISGNKAIIGSPGASEDGSASGRAYIVSTISGQLLHELVNPNQYSNTDNDRFGSAVAISSKYAIVGALEDGTYNDQGVAYVYDVNSGSLLYTIENPSLGNSERFAGDDTSVAITDTHIIIGAQNDNSFVGGAYIYNAVDGSLLYTLSDPSGFGGDFGISVGLSDSHAIIGDSSNDQGASNSGKAYVYDLSTGNLVYTFDNPNDYDTETGDSFGRTVHISNSYAVVGATNEDEAAFNSTGKAYVFDLSDGSLLHTLDNPNPDAGTTADYFGWDVAINESYVVAASHREYEGVTAVGKVYVFDVTDGSLLHTVDCPDIGESLTSANFGRNIDMSGDKFIAGAYLQVGPSTYAGGAAHIVDITRL